MQIKAMPGTPSDGFPVWARVVMVTALIYLFMTTTQRTQQKDGAFQNLEWWWWSFRSCVSLQILLPRERNMHVKRRGRTASEEGKEVLTKRRKIPLPERGSTTSQSPHLHCHNSPEMGSLAVEVCHSFSLEEA